MLTHRLQWSDRLASIGTRNRPQSPVPSLQSLVPSPQSLGPRNSLAREHAGARKEALATCDGPLEVIDEFEVALAKFEHRDVSRRTNFERPAILEHWESP